MKRRKFGLLAGSSVAALQLGAVSASAQTAADPSLLTTTLTPMGSERAGNADGSIPARLSRLILNDLQRTWTERLRLVYACWLGHLVLLGGHIYITLIGFIK
jgi:hypothetical protein